MIMDRFKFIMPILVLILIIPAHVTDAMVNNENIKWSDTGNTYKLTPDDNTVTEKEYTVVAVDLPSPVRGYKTINGSIYPERPVAPFVKLELYKDIINNSAPIDTFSLGIGDEYITQDQETRITIDDIPDSTSQDWVYEYYKPWVVVKIQKRSVPILDIGISLTNSSGDDIYEDNIRSGDNIKVYVSIKNTGEDAIEDVNFNIDIGQLLLDNTAATSKLKDTVHQLNKDEEKIINLSLIVPTSLEEKEYEIKVNTTGHDIKDATYYFNASKIINVKSDVDAIYIEKSISRNTSYLKEYVGVVLNIVNSGHATISNIQLHDEVPDGLIIVKNGAVQNYTEFSLNKSSIGPAESWIIDYSVKPTEPGIYILPQFDVNFSIGEKNLSAISSEIGFRVFGPQVVLNKSAKDMGNGIVEVIVGAKNVGNGPTRVVIKDQIPNNTAFVLGDMELTTSLNPDEEKIMDYTIRSYNTNISKLIWPPARATYYLDDWRFNTSSDETYEGVHRVKEGYILKGGTDAHVIVSAHVAIENAYPEVAVPKIEEKQKQVVATIPVKTPVQTPEKSIPGFMSYETVLLLAIMIFIKKINLKK